MSAEKKNTHTKLLVKGGEGRLDRYLTKQFPDWSRTSLQRLINARRVLVDGHPASPNHRLLAGQTVSIQWPEPKKLKEPIELKQLPFPVIHEDGAILVINKPPGLVVHPAAGHFDGNTLVEMVASRLSPGIWPDEMRPGMVHRLDRDTSGVIVLAKTPEAHAKLSKQFARRQVKKTYIAVVKGTVDADEGIMECNIARHPGKRQRFAVSASGRWASTRFRVTERIGSIASVVRLNPLTGRTHQLRVQLASLNHPILGDHVYGVKNGVFDFIQRQLLHAEEITLCHPVTGKEVAFHAQIPDDIQSALKVIRSMA